MKVDQNPATQNVASPGNAIRRMVTQSHDTLNRMGQSIKDTAYCYYIQLRDRCAQMSSCLQATFAILFYLAVQLSVFIVAFCAWYVAMSIKLGSTPEN